MKYIGKRVLALLLFVTLLVPMLSGVTVSFAENDDPGNNRLEGKVPPSFYEGATMGKLWKDAAANPYDGKVHSHNDRYTGMQVINGIDVSEHNVITDWNAVKNSGMDFAIIRAAYRGYGKAGTLNSDKRYDENITGALAAGLQVGIYIYSQAITVEEAQAEADLLYSKIGSYNISLPLVLDYEYFSETADVKGRLYDAKLTKEQATAVCLAFCERIASYGYQPMVYANSSMLTYHLNATDISNRYPIWLANYVSVTSYSGAYNMWQYGSGKVPGISGDCDLNYWYTSDPNEFSVNMRIAPIADQFYTGNAITPALSVTSKGTALVENQDYTVSYVNNVERGTATAYVTGINAYAGLSAKADFKIIDNKVEGLRVASKSKTAVTLNWQACAGAASYDIYMSEAVDSTFKKVATVEGTATAYTHAKRKAGKEYYYYVSALLADRITHVASEVVVARTSKPSTRKVYLKKAYKLRKATNTGERVVKVKKHTLVTLVADAKKKGGSDWYYVSYKIGGKKYYGYLPKSYGTVYYYGKTSTKHVSLRKGAGTKKRLVTVIAKKNKKVTITGSKKDGRKKVWYKVSVKQGKYTYTGYIHSRYVKLY